MAMFFILGARFKRKKVDKKGGCLIKKGSRTFQDKECSFFNHAVMTD